MNNDVIGFKLADGSFYPVFEEGAAVEKQLELTTVRDDQTTIQLHLYKSPSGTMEDAKYVETLILENLVPHPKEEPSLSLKISLDEEGNLAAEIIDPETGTSSSTNVSLVTLDEATLHEMEMTGDFSIDDEMPTMSEFTISQTDDSPVFSLPVDDDFSLPDTADVQEDHFDIDFPDTDFDTSGMDSSDSADDDRFSFNDIPDFGDVPEAGNDQDLLNDLDPGNPMVASFSADDDFFEEEERRSQRRVRLPVIICVVCAIISVIVLGIILFLTPSRIRKVDPEPECTPAVEITAPVEDLTKARENEVVVSPVPVIPEPVKKPEPIPDPAPVAAEPAAEVPVQPVTTAPVTAKKEPQSVRYKLKWGDTLWDLADAYYRNPWQYKKIARWNGIKNPDYIIAGTYIYIPE